MTIYLFGRTDREKEDWFRRLAIATHKDMGFFSTDSSNPDIKETLADPMIEAVQSEMEYLKYMNIYKVCHFSFDQVKYPKWRHHLKNDCFLNGQTYKRK